MWEKRKHRAAAENVRGITGDGVFTRMALQDDMRRSAVTIIMTHRNKLRGKFGGSCHKGVSPTSVVDALVKGFMSTYTVLCCSVARRRTDPAEGQLTRLTVAKASVCLWCCG